MRAEKFKFQIKDLLQDFEHRELSTTRNKRSLIIETPLFLQSWEAYNTFAFNHDFPIMFSKFHLI